jgi:hypothetical protein
MNEAIFSIKIHPSARNIVPLLLFPIMFVIFLIIINIDNHRIVGTESIIIANLCIGTLLFIGIFGIILYYFSWYLIITPMGIEYHNIGYQISGKWENIFNLSRRVRRQFGRINRVWFSYFLDEDLIVKSPEIKASSIIKIIIQSFDQDQSIPIRSIDRNWRNTEYGKYILMRISRNNSI